MAAPRRAAWLTGPVTIPTLLSFILGATIDVTLLAYGARRLLAERRFSLSRTIVAGLAGQALTSTIFPAMASGWHLGARQPSVAYGAVLGFAALSWACGLLLAMAILVTWQAFIPAGTVPPPATWPRSLRSRAARSRRYWQIVRIFAHCGVRPLSWAQIERVIGEELGGTGMFTEIDTDPLASASIAQVHAATLRTGERVVLKVLRPGVTSLVERDLDIIARLARRTEARVGWARAIGVVNLAAGFAVALREELDFRVEAGNLAAVGAANGATADSARIVIPRAYHDLSTRRVLVMERLDGQALSKAAHDPLADCDRERLARELLDSLLRQIVVDGIFHADPHPGNILLLADGRLGLIDFGAVGRLDSGLRAALQRLMLAIDRRDPVAMTDALLEVTARPDDLDEQALELSVGALLVRHLASGRAPDATMFADLFRLVTRHELAVPPEFVATAGGMAVALLALKGGPAMTATISLYQFLGYCLLVICALLALRVLAAVFRTGP
jgi:ubiquinone biosynthesis protein